jgi:outer membrane protein assembly factor BamA
MLSIVVILLSVLRAAPQATFTLAVVEVSRANRLTREDVGRLSGLAIGKPVSLTDLQPAAERLATTGLFSSVAYRYVTASGRLTVTFDVVEAEATVPVIFDNFVWLPPEQITAAVRADMPYFEGKAPHTEGAPDLIARSLQKLLSARKIPGKVAFVPQATLKGDLVGYIFKVEEPSPKICAVTLQGAGAQPQKDLVTASASLIGTDYSHSFVTGMSAGTLVDIYRRFGYWRASFAPPAVAVDAPGCTGVSVTLKADEGPSYSWTRAQWSGQTAATVETLDKLLGMKPGDLADGAKIAAGLNNISKAYGRQGFIMARASHVPRLDDAAKTAVFDITLDEGPRFQMGTVQFLGFSDQEAAALTKRWTLAEGGVYDDTYPVTFGFKEVSPLRRGSTPASLETFVDSPNRRVNVRFVVK